MFTRNKCSVLGLVLCAGVVGAIASGSATSVAAIPEPVMEATLQSQTLHVIGSNFGPGGTVAIALVNTRAMKLVAKGSTHAQDSVVWAPCPWNYSLCAKPNPKAGTLSYTMHLKRAMSASNLELLYRSAGKTRSQAVKAAVQTVTPPPRCGVRVATCEASP
jgi:hypothetical protein